MGRFKREPGRDVSDCHSNSVFPKYSITEFPQEANFVDEMEDSPDFWSGPVQCYISPVEHRFLIELDRSTNGLLPDCDRKYVSVQTMPPGYIMF